MKTLRDVVANTMLIAVLFGLLFLPLGSMSLSGYTTNNDVLSDYDVREPIEVAQPTPTKAVHYQQRYDESYVMRGTDETTTKVNDVNESTEPVQHVDYRDF